MSKHSIRKICVFEIVFIGYEIIFFLREICESRSFDFGIKISKEQEAVRAIISNLV